jgi:hypothetical protein
MAIKTFTSGEVLTAADTNSYLNNGGLVYINEFSGTAAAALTIDTCFSSTFQNYRIVCSAFGSSVTTLRLAYRTGGVTNPNALFYQRGFVLAAANTVTNNSAVTSGAFMSLSNASSIVNFGVADINNPAVATRTQMICQSSDNQVPQMEQYINNWVDSTTFDGFTLIPTAGTVTGKVIVYGYRQA